MMRFLVDAQLPPRLVSYLASRGHDAEHVTETLGERAKDGEIVAHAAAQNAVIVTKDGDFIALLDGHVPAPPLLWVRVGNAANRTLFERLDQAWPRIEAELNSAKPVVEVD